MRVIYFTDLGQDFPAEVIDLGVSLDSMPSDPIDSSGSTGEVNFVIGAPEDPDHPLVSQGYSWAIDKVFRLSFGSTTLEGRVVQGGENENGTQLNFTGSTTAFRLQAFNVVVPPVRDTLGNVLRAYLSRIGITDWAIEGPSAILNRQVIYPGWTGEFWPRIKMLCAAEGIDLNFTTWNKIKVSPSRGEEVFHTYSTSKSIASGGGSLAQFVEVYDYSSRWVQNGLVYPPGGWSDDVPVLGVGNNEYVEHFLELSTSLVSFQTPTMVEFVSQMHDDSSVYTIVADDGFPLKPAQWVAYGGDVQFEVGQEFNTIAVKMRGPAKMINPETGEPFSNFQLALGADTSGSRYSTLRIVGTGVQYDREVLRIPTGVAESETGTEVGATIDNPFLRTRSMSYSAGVLAATKFQGFDPALTITSQSLFEGNDILMTEPHTYFKESTRIFRTRNVNYTPNEMSVTTEPSLTFRDLSFLNTATFRDLLLNNPGASLKGLWKKGLQIGY